MKESKNNKNMENENIDEIVDKKFEEDLTEIKQKLNTEKLSDEFKEKLLNNLENELKEFKNGRMTYLERAAKPDFRYESEKYAADICAYDSFGGYLTDFSQDKVLFERFFNDTNLTSFNRAFKELTSSPSVLLTVTIPESDLGKININTEIFEKNINNVSKSKITQEKYDYSDIKLIKEDVKKGEIVSQKKVKNLDNYCR